jgi:hypothetical protein
VRAVVKGFEGPDGEEPGSYVSPDPFDDSFWLRMLVGPSGGPGEESFDVLVCTPAWLARAVVEHGPQIGRHRLVVERLDLPAAEAFLRRQIERLEAATWDELAGKLAGPRPIGDGDLDQLAAALEIVQAAIANRTRWQPRHRY